MFWRSSCSIILLSSSLSNNASNNPSVFSVDAFGTFQIKTQWKESDSVSSHTMIMNKNKFFQKSTELKGKWDFLDDEDDEFEPQGPEVAKDMRYIEFNIMRSNKSFVDIREAGGPSMTNDVYARDPDSNIFWFCGKIARVSDVSVEQAVARQYSLIEEHASRLRSTELYPKRGSIELWTAPGDSEMDVAYNRPHIKFVKIKRCKEVDGAEKIRNIEIGFQGEIYDSGEEGFRTTRSEDGLPLRPEIQGPEEKGEVKGEVEGDGEKRAPTDEEMAKINEMLKGQDLNELFNKEQ